MRFEKLVKDNLSELDAYIYLLLLRNYLLSYLLVESVKYLSSTTDYLRISIQLN